MATTDSGVRTFNANVENMDDVRRALQAIKEILTKGPIVFDLTSGGVYFKDEQAQYWKLSVDSSSSAGSLVTSGPYTGV